MVYLQVSVCFSFVIQLQIKYISGYISEEDATRPRSNGFGKGNF